MKRVDVPSYPISIFIAGNIRGAEAICSDYCDERGLCVTVSETNYIYTHGQQYGVVVGLINYGRFPAPPEQIWSHAEVLAERLRIGLKQESYTIQAPDKTVWISFREGEAA